MLRKGITAALLAGWLATPVQAGLQSAMTTALTGLQAAETVTGLKGTLESLPPILTITPILGLRIDSNSSYDDFLFVDPVVSKKSEAVYRHGPELTYNPRTGGLSIIAPPLLGPADEFGIRQSLSPSSIRIYARGLFSDGPIFPEVRRYERNVVRSLGSILQPKDDSGSSFHLTDNTNYSLNISNGRIDLDLHNNGFLSGAEVHFPNLITKELGPEFYNANSGFVPDINLWPLLGPYFAPANGPDVHIAVQYGLSIYSGIGFGGYTFLAVPKIVPEPTTSLFVLMASTMLLARRTQRR